MTGKHSFFVSFIVINLLLVFSHIYKQSEIIRLSYQQQKLENELLMLGKKKDLFIQQLYALHDKNSVKKYATQTLALKPIKVSQIRKINHESNL